MGNCSASWFRKGSEQKNNLLCICRFYVKFYIHNEKPKLVRCLVPVYFGRKEKEVGKILTE